MTRPTDKDGRPFLLTHDEHHDWAVAQGAEELWSLEEGIYNGFLRPFVELGLIPYMGGWFRTRNKTSLASDSPGLSYCFEIGLFVWYHDRGDRYWFGGAGARKFQAVA